MKATGVVRRIDNLGRMVIPRRSGEIYVYARGILWQSLLIMRVKLSGEIPCQ